MSTRENAHTVLVIGRAAPPTYYLTPGADEVLVPMIGGPWGGGTWLGGGAHGLGLTGQVDAGALTAVLTGRRPGGARPLASRPAAIQGFDLTFSAPKSVSLLAALGSADVTGAVVDAHRSAVAATMDYMDRRAVTVRRRDRGERVVLDTGGAIAATFTHGVSRTLDPHLHSHVVVANLAHGADGRWSALDARGLFAHRSAADALYQAHLRYSLTCVLGVRWAGRATTGYELADVDPTAAGLLSNRSVAIRAHLAGRATPGAGAHASTRSRRVAWASTRDPKDAAVEATAIRHRWAQIAASAGFGPPELRALLERRHVRTSHIDERRFAVVLMSASYSSTNRRGVVGAWASSAVDGATVAEVERSADWVLATPPPERHEGHPGLVAAADREPAGVAEPSRGFAGVVPRGYLVRTLGPRPLGEHHQLTWGAAAEAIDRYRARWDVLDRADALGPETVLSRLPTRQLADRVRTAAQVEEARLRLGRHRTPALDRPNELERSSSLGRG